MRFFFEIMLKKKTKKELINSNKKLNNEITIANSVQQSFRWMNM